MKSCDQNCSSGSPLNSSQAGESNSSRSRQGISCEAHRLLYNNRCARSGKGAPDSLQKGYETQAWLAVSNDDKARVTGRYFHHQKRASIQCRIEGCNDARKIPSAVRRHHRIFLDQTSDS